MGWIRKSFDLNIKKDAFPFQKESFDIIKDEEYFAIFHEQGLGKTKIAIDLAYYWLEENVVDSVLILTKKSLINNWIDELDFHGNLPPILIDGDKKKNFNKLSFPGYLYLTNYESIRNNIRAFKSFLKFKKVGVILDESTFIKNPSSKITIAMHELAPLFKKRIIMTGTPISNRPYDIWSQLFFLDLGKRLGGSFESFKDEHDLSNELHKDIGGQIIFENNLKRLKEKIRDCNVRETKQTAGIELPGRRFIAKFVEMDAKQKMLYKKMQEDLSAEVLKDGKLISDNVEAILKRLIRLVQISSNPKLVDESYSNVPPKLKETENIVEEVFRTNSKTLIWTNFVDNVEEICAHFSEKGSVGIHGNKDTKERNKLIKKFKKDESTKILVATPGVAREGLTLVEANHAIFYDRNFSLENYLQAQDRIYRISQKRDCCIYKLLSNDSIDFWVDALLDAKEVAARYGQGDIEQIEYKERMNYDFAEILLNILNADSA